MVYLRYYTFWSLVYDEKCIISPIPDVYVYDFDLDEH